MSITYTHVQTLGNWPYLIGETVKGAGKTAHAGCEGQVWVGQGTSYQVAGMSGDVAALVVSMDAKVEAQKFVEFITVVAKHGGEVRAPIFLWVDRPDSAILVGVAVDDGRYGWKLGNEVHGVFIHVLESK